MDVVAQNGNHYAVRLDRGEEIKERIQVFCEQESITGAFFYGIGAAENVELAYFNRDTKTYENDMFEESMEVVAMTGNVAEKDGELLVHVHGCFGWSDKNAVAGHIQRATVSVTCEIHLIAFPDGFSRTHDPAVDLPLLS